MDITKSSFLEAADKFADSERRQGLWEVWQEYEIHPRKDGESYLLAVEPNLTPPPGSKRDLERALEWSGGRVFRGSTAAKLLGESIERTKYRKETFKYHPLVEEPGLFLKFAHLADQDKLDTAATLEELDTDKNAATAKEWAETYGVLGLATVEKHGIRGVSTRGGRAETVAAFANEAWVANGVLRLYETAMADEVDVGLIRSYMTYRPPVKALYTRTPAMAREWALVTVASVTQEKVAGNAYPALYGKVGRFVQGWDFKNLLGAMWLQMFWLVTAAEAPRRCKECDKIIAYEQPDQPQGTKKRGRKKEKFCDKECRDRYVYRTKTKPRRQAARQAREEPR